MDHTPQAHPAATNAKTKNLLRTEKPIRRSIIANRLIFIDNRSGGLQYLRFIKDQQGGSAAGFEATVQQ
jgi:hypothetical protein